MKNTTIKTVIYRDSSTQFQTLSIGRYTFQLHRNKFTDHRKRFNDGVWCLDEVVIGKDTTSPERRWLKSITKKVFNQLKRKVGKVEIPEICGGPFGGRSLQIRK